MHHFMWKNLKRNHPASLKRMTLLSIIGIIGLITWSILLPIEISVSSPGEILNEDNVVEIKSPFSGIIKKFQVENGSQILQGTPLLTFEDIETTDLIDLKKVSIKNLRCHIDTEKSALDFLNNKYDALEKAFESREEQLLDFLGKYHSTCSKVFNYGISSVYRSLKMKLTRMRSIYLNRLDLENKSSLLRALLSSHQKDLTMMKNLFEKNAVSQNDLNQQERIVYKSTLELRENIHEQKNMLRHINELYDEANLEFANYLKEISRDLEQNQRTFADEMSKLTILEKTREQKTILSPIAGTIVYNQSFSSSNYAQQSQPLMKIVPHSKLTYIRAKVTPKQIQHVKKGYTATVRFPHYADIREKKFKAIIEKIDPIISQQDNNLQTQEYYEVILKITDLAFSDNNIELRNGLPAEVLFTAKNTTLAQEIIHPITDNWPKIFER
nr:type I secretion membrane fusion protein [Candidatus Liberibacter asiaticus]